MSEIDVLGKEYEKAGKPPAPRHFARRASTHEDDEICPVATDETESAGRVISGETDDIAIKYSEAKKLEKHYEKGEKAIAVARKHLERRSSAHGEDETLPIAVDENASAGRVISGETDDMAMKHAELQYALIMK